MKSDDEINAAIEQAMKQMDMLINDTSVPKNVRSVITQARNELNSKNEYVVRVSSAIYNLDEVSNDINLPQQARTMIWSILSQLESIKSD